MVILRGNYGAFLTHCGRFGREIYDLDRSSRPVIRFYYVELLMLTKL